MKIERVTLQQLGELQAISQSTFADAYGPFNTFESMEEYFATSLSIQKLTEEIKSLNARFYFLTGDNGQPVAYLKVNFWTDVKEWAPADSLEIERLYVKKEFQRKKYGTRLMNFAIQLGEEHHINHFWLGVWEFNPDAIRFYETLGYKVVDKHIFRFGNEDQYDFIMHKCL